MFSGVAVRRRSWIVLDAAVIDLCQDAPSESVLRAQHTVNGIWDWPPNRYVESASAERGPVWVTSGGWAGVRDWSANQQIANRLLHCRGRPRRATSGHLYRALGELAHVGHAGRNAQA
jgi:hypothetical protein